MSPKLLRFTRQGLLSAKQYVNRYAYSLPMMFNSTTSARNDVAASFLLRTSLPFTPVETKIIDLLIHDPQQNIRDITLDLSKYKKHTSIDISDVPNPPQRYWGLFFLTLGSYYLMGFEYYYEIISYIDFGEIKKNGELLNLPDYVNYAKYFYNIDNPTNVQVLLTEGYLDPTFSFLEYNYGTKGYYFFSGVADIFSEKHFYRYKAQPQGMP